MPVAPAGKDALTGDFNNADAALVFAGLKIGSVKIQPDQCTLSGRHRYGAGFVHLGQRVKNGTVAGGVVPVGDSFPVSYAGEEFAVVPFKGFIFGYFGGDLIDGSFFAVVVKFWLLALS